MTRSEKNYLIIQLVPIGVLTVCIGAWVYIVCKDFSDRTRKRDLEQMELGLKIGSAIQKGMSNVGIDSEQTGPAEGQKGPPKTKAPVGHEGGNGEAIGGG